MSPQPRTAYSTHAITLCAALALSACGGGGESGAGSTTPSEPTTEQRTQAAQATAASQPSCVAAQPFYWEVGNAQATLGSGTAGGNTYGASTVMPIASASKWVYASYVVQKRGGVQQLSSTDITQLHFTSGYSIFNPLTCTSSDTVGSCNALTGYDANTLNQFDYGGGHMQRHADVEMGLGALDAAGFTTELLGQLSGVSLYFNSPQPGGGGYASAANYGALLRKIMSGQLLMQGALGTHAVCANPGTCQVPDNTAAYSPIPSTETWHYSIGHWVEDDPGVGDGAFSSPGAYGFYPWIDRSKTTYGLLARFDPTGQSISDPAQKPYFRSIACGRLIRKAWFSGQAVTQ